jgi:hypothetical protein
MRLPDMDRFTSAYADAALADSVDDDGITLRVHGLGRLASETVRRMRVDCANFRQEAGDVADAFDMREVAGDFWMERNRRPFGGFFDGDYPQPAATELAQIARRFEPVELYLDDDDHDGLIRFR